MEIKVVENVLKLNDEVARQNRELLDNLALSCLNIMGSPGCGKTAILERTLETLREQLNIGVITGDMATTRDAERLAAYTTQISQINVGNACHLDANQVRKGMDNLDLTNLDLLIIENVGNLICPVGFDLGQHAKVGIFSVPEGDDKPAKHPYIILEADLLILNKVDLLPYIPFNIESFAKDLASVREDVQTLNVSATTGDGFDEWLNWVCDFAKSHNP